MAITQKPDDSKPALNANAVAALSQFPPAQPGTGDSCGLLRGEDRWRNLVESSLQGIMVHRGARLLFVNQALIDMAGYADSEDLLACPRSIDLVAREDRGRIKAYLLNCTRETTPASRIQVKALRKDGTTFIAENTARIIDWDGTPALLSTILDVSEQHKTQLKLHESEARYRECDRLLMF